MGEFVDLFKNDEAKAVLEKIEDSELALSSNPVPTLLNAKQNENNFR